METKPVDYAAMTIDELEAANLELSNKREQIREEQLALTAVLDRKRTTEAATAHVAGMTDETRAALLQAIQAAGVPEVPH